MNFKQRINFRILQKLLIQRSNAIAKFNKRIHNIVLQKMTEVKNIKIKNLQRVEKRNTAKERLNHMTEKKYFDRQSTCRTVSRLERKFEYDYDF
jgi:hypothetical protein